MIQGASCSMSRKTEPNGRFISGNDKIVGWIPFVDNEFVFYNFGSQSEQNLNSAAQFLHSSHCQIHKKRASGARSSSSDVKTIHERRFRWTRGRQILDGILRPNTGILRVGKQLKPNKPNYKRNATFLIWNAISEMETNGVMKVFSRMSCARHKWGNGTWEGRKREQICSCCRTEFLR